MVAVHRELELLLSESWWLVRVASGGSATLNPRRCSRTRSWDVTSAANTPEAMLLLVLSMAPLRRHGMRRAMKGGACESTGSMHAEESMRPQSYDCYSNASLRATPDDKSPIRLCQ